MCRLVSEIGSSWEQLKSYERLREEAGDDLDRLVILHDFERWKHFRKVKDVEGFVIFQAA